MATAAPQPCFRFDDVPPKDQDWLRRRTYDVHTLAYRTVCDLIRIGQLLAEVRDRIRKRKFRAWLAAETPISRPQAYRFMNVARAFAPYVSHAETERITPTALYILSQPSTPPPARAHAAYLAGQGDKVTGSVARDILDACRPIPDLDRAELRATEAASGTIRDRLAAVRDVVAETTPRARLGAALEELSRAGTMFHVSRVTEDGTDADATDEPIYSVTAHIPRRTGPPEVRSCVRRTLLDAIESILGREERAKCPTCREVKPVSEFGLNRRTTTGRNRYCKACERARMARLKAKRRADKAGGRPVA